MNKRVAVMDLGTNTFHLLIAEKTDKGIVEIDHVQDAVKLGEGGINKGFIQPAAFDRGINSMKKFGELIRENDVSQVRAIATSALRNASNGQDFIEQVKMQTGIAIEIINGDQEAAFIYKGIKASGCLSGKNSLIMDIGGGSVEFIICNDEEVFWKQSFEIGAARLMDKFHKIDPIPGESIAELNSFLDACLQTLFTEASKYTIDHIIGSSGVFESYAEVIELSKGNPFDLKTTKNYNFNSNALSALIEKIILSSHHDRVAAKGILSIRVDMIVTASLLTRFVIQRLGINSVTMSTNSLKEGVLADIVG